MKKIVYVMQVDWNWIKQRPHFIAEHLSNKYDVTVMYQHRYTRTGYQKRDTGGLDIKPIYVIPKGDRYPVLRSINRWIKSRAIRRQTKKSNADCLYLTFPDQLDAIPANFAGKVIYDCMDNHPAFLSDAAERAALEQQEGTLVQRSDEILVSSENLKDVLLERYGQIHAGKITLVRNGYNGQIMEVNDNPVQNNDCYTLAYFGTISSWFNFEFVLKSLEDFPNLEYLLIGPSENNIPQHPRVRYIGTVEHSQLPEVTKDAQCLIMPFVLNEIIEAVDPVKLYEYINFNKNILCVEYPEIARFAPFVHFYTDYQSYCQQLRLLMNSEGVKYSQAERTAFLCDNNWESRVRLIEGLL